jgi:uncharacterized membrane protein
MKTDWRLEAPQLLLIAGMFAAAAWAWPQLPNKIPTHWNIRGEVDGYGNRFTGLLLLPITVAVLYPLFRFLPSIDPGKRHYENFATAYGVFRIAFSLFMAGMYATTIVAAFGRHVDVTMIVCLMAGALLAVLGNLMGKIRPNWFIGVRTPWTLSSQASWNKTHHLAGWLFMLMGLAVAAAGVVQTGWMLAGMLTVLLGSLAWMVVYSFVIYRRDPHRQSPAGITPADEK